MKKKKRSDENVFKKEIPKFFIKFFLSFIIYFIVGKLGLSLAFYHPSASPIWPATGVAIAALLILGYRFWPAIFLGAFFVNITTVGTILSSLGIATGNTLEGLLAVFLIKKFAGGKSTFDKPKGIFIFLLIILFTGFISATIGVISLSLMGFAVWENYILTWLTWWVGNVVGAVVVFPLIIFLYRPLNIMSGRIAEGILIMITTLIFGLFIFTQYSPFASEHYPIHLLCLIPLTWASFRIGQKGTILSILIISTTAIFGTLNGFGPFALGTPNESLFFLQIYIGVVTTIGLVLTSLVMGLNKNK